MAYTPARLYQGQAPATETTLYTAGGGTILKEIVAVNTTGGSVALSLSLVPSGGTAGAANRLFYQLALSAGQTSVIDLSQVMATGDFLSALAASASAVTLTISGVTL
jgi:hypothetical protein